MNIVTQMHRASVTDAQRRKYERMVGARARKLPRGARAVVRLSESGVVRRVEIVLDVPRQATLVAAAEGKWFATCVAQALDRLDAQILSAKQTPKTRARHTRRTLPPR